MEQSINNNFLTEYQPEYTLYTKKEIEILQINKHELIETKNIKYDQCNPFLQGPDVLNII